mgnify:CR=1 FL=1
MKNIVVSAKPFPMLIIPNTNQSLTIQPESFHLMNAMEFLADQYASFITACYVQPGTAVH